MKAPALVRSFRENSPKFCFMNTVTTTPHSDFSSRNFLLRILNEDVKDLVIGECSMGHIRD